MNRFVSDNIKGKEIGEVSTVKLICKIASPSRTSNYFYAKSQSCALKEGNRTGNGKDPFPVG